MTVSEAVEIFDISDDTPLPFLRWFATNVRNAGTLFVEMASTTLE
jgi:hypothetical protein